MTKEMTMVRIYISEADRGKHGILLDEIMDILHDQQRVHGVTVFRGIVGFGAKGKVHSADLLRLRPHLPLVIEFFDEPAVVESAIKALDGLIPPGHMIHWSVTGNTS